MAQHLVPSFSSGVTISLDFHSLCHDEKANRQRGFALWLLNFHGILVRLVDSHFPANFISFALLLGCRTWAANGTAGSWSFPAWSLVME